MNVDAPFDPRLKEAMAEVRAILAKFDIAAEVMLVSETHSEYMHWLFEPTWSAVKLEKGGIRLKMALKSGDAAERAKAKATVHMAHQLRDLSADAFTLHDSLCKLMQQHLNIEVTPRRHTPHEEI